MGVIIVNIVYKNPKELIHYENNAKIHDDKQIKNIVESIKKYGFMQNVVIDKNDVIVVGHGRILAAIQAGIDSVPCKYADNLTEKQIREYRVLDNKLNESPWDLKLLEIEFDDLDFSDFDIDFGFDLEDDTAEDDDTYTKKIKTPQYEITGEEVSLTDLTQESKYDELISDINKSGLPEKQKSFLRFAACRHIVFDFHKIAEYYAGADKEMQTLMENSALVIIDFDDAIKNGYVKLSTTLDEFMGDESGEVDNVG